MSARPTHNFQRGLTTVELLIAVAILSIMGAAMGAFAIALGTAWEKDDQRSALQAAARQLEQRLGNILVSTRFAVPAGTVESFPDPDFESSGVDVSLQQGDALLIWSDDSLIGGTGVMQAGEIALIRFDASSGSLYHHRPVSYNLLGAIAKETAALPVSFGELTSGAVEAFVIGQNIFRRELLVGVDAGLQPMSSTANPTTRVLVRSVRFTVHNDATGRSRRVSYSVELARGRESQTVKGSVAVRHPSARPS